MTLSTTLYVHGIVRPAEMLAELRQHLAAYDPDGRTPEQHRDLDNWHDNPNEKTIGNAIGQGLPSILLLTYCPDGPRVTAEQAAAHDEWCDDDCDGSGHEPAHVLEVNWDTSYGYRHPEVGGCSQLHARLIVSAGQWLDAKGVDWSWQNEYTGEYHHRYDGLAEFIGDGANADAWFTGTVLPALNATAS